MSSTFPHFKPLDINDRAVVQSFTIPDSPYSDFNFTNLWAWDVEGGRKISELRGNLVLLLTDYQTGQPFLSFIGTNDAALTAKELIAYAVEQGIDPVLRLISREVAEQLRDDAHFCIESDLGNHDYIFSIEKIAEGQNPDLKNKLRAVRQFREEYSDATFDAMPLNEYLPENILHCFHVWGNNKKQQDNYREIETIREEAALTRVLWTYAREYDDLILSTAHVGNRLIGFCIDEVLPDGYALSHFIKGYTHYPGIYEFLNQNTAIYLKSRGSLYWNWEQDLNIEGLRKVKSSYRPIRMLEKYTVKNAPRDVLG